MKILTDKAKLICAHRSGVVQIFTLQHLVTIDGDPVLVWNDPEGKPIVACPNVGTNIKPCTWTLRATDGYSTLIRINARPVCLDTVTGNTDGTPPSAIRYLVANPGQDFVEEVG